jgi:hypothetical protein
MSDEGSDSNQRRDALLLRLLKMPPQSRASLPTQCGAQREEVYSGSPEAF